MCRSRQTLGSLKPKQGAGKHRVRGPTLVRPLLTGVVRQWGLEIEQNLRAGLVPATTRNSGCQAGTDSQVCVWGWPPKTRVGNILEVMNRGFQLYERADSQFPNCIRKNSELLGDTG